MIRLTSRRLLRSFPFFALAFLAFCDPVAAANGSSTDNTPLDLKNVCLVTVGISTQVGGIVVVFLAYAIQELQQRASIALGDPEKRYKLLRERSRLQVLRINAQFAIIFLLVAPIIVLFGLITDALDLQFLVILAVASFNSGILLMLLSLLAFIILEKPFLAVAREW